MLFGIPRWPPLSQDIKVMTVFFGEYNILLVKREDIVRMAYTNKILITLSK
jgi:hypothetical protein